MRGRDEEVHAEIKKAELENLQSQVRRIKTEAPTGSQVDEVKTEGEFGRGTKQTKKNRGIE